MNRSDRMLLLAQNSSPINVRHGMNRSDRMLLLAQNSSLINVRHSMNRSDRMLLLAQNYFYLHVLVYQVVHSWRLCCGFVKHIPTLIFQLISHGVLLMKRSWPSVKQWLEDIPTSEQSVNTCNLVFANGGFFYGKISHYILLCYWHDNAHVIR